MLDVRPVQDSPRRITRRRSSLADPEMIKKTSKSTERSAGGASQDGKFVRKRAAMACDQCRRRKSRCDGKLDCGACKAIGLQCSYGERVKQTRGPSYVAHLEKKIEELEGRVSSLAEPNSANGQPVIHFLPTGEAASVSRPTTGIGSLSTMPVLIPDNWSWSTPESMSTLIAAAPGQQQHLSTITKNETRAKTYGIDILRQLWNFCSRIKSSPVSNRLASSLKLVQALDSPSPVDSIPVTGGHPLLPPKLNMIYWMDIAFAEALDLWPFAERAFVDKVMYRVYNTNTFGQDENDKDELALLYALLALGQRFDSSTTASAIDRRTQGLSYFAAAKAMVPLANCDRSIAAIQTVLCLALYLKAGSAQTRVHAYLSAASSAALRIGIHESHPYFPESERALRRGIWSTIYVLSVYVSASLGIPHIGVPGQGFEDPFPARFSEVSAEDAKACASHYQLIRLFNSSIERTYCRSDTEVPFQNGAFSVPIHAIQATAEELDSWAQNHVPDSRSIVSMNKCEILLAYSYAHVQLVLYSPFVHHLAQPSANKDSRECFYGSKCVQAASQAIQIAEILQKRMQLNEAYLNTVDVLAFAAMTLLVVELGSADAALLGEAIRSGKRAKQLLLFLSLQSTAAAECWQALSVCGDTHNEKGAGSFADALPRGPLFLQMDSDRPAEPSRPSMAHFPDSAIDVGAV